MRGVLAAALMIAGTMSAAATQIPPGHFRVGLSEAEMIAAVEENQLSGEVQVSYDVGLRSWTVHVLPTNGGDSGTIE